MPDEFLQALGAAVRALRARLERELQPHGLHVGQQQVLRALWERDGLTPREIAERLSVEMPTVTRAVQRMERGGFVRRAAHPGDARSVRVLLTPKGCAVREVVDALLERQTQAALRGFDDAERRQIAALLQRIVENLRA